METYIGNKKIYSLNKNSLELLEIIMYANKNEELIGIKDQAYEELKRKIKNMEKMNEKHLKGIERLEKVEKLLDLYRKWFMSKTTKEQDDITNKIVKLEEELE